MLRVMVLVSGGGTNLQAIIDAVAAGTITNAEIVGVLSNNKTVKSLERAKNAGIPAVSVSPNRCLYRLSFTRLLFPLPLTPVTHTSIPSGMETVRFLRLLTLAPRTVRYFPFPFRRTDGTGMDSFPER